MEQNKESSIPPIDTSSKKFGVEYENNFLVLDDAEHVIGVDAKNPKNLILENLSTGEKVKFGGDVDCITTLIYDKNTETLLVGDKDGYVIQYKVDLQNPTCEDIKFFDLEIGEIFSSCKFMDYVFFGGDRSKIKVLNLSTGELLPGQIDTTIDDIYSLQICVVNETKIYLAVSGEYFSDPLDRSDLFDLSLFFETEKIRKKYLDSNDKFSLAFKLNKVEDELKNAKQKIMLQTQTILKLTKESKNLRKQKKQTEILKETLETKNQNLIKKLILFKEYKEWNKALINDSIAQSQILKEIDSGKFISDLQLKLDIQIQKNKNLKVTINDIIFENNKYELLVQNQKNEIKRLEKRVLNLKKTKSERYFL